MKTKCFPLLLASLAALGAVAEAQTITLSSGLPGQIVAFDAARHFVYEAQDAGPGGSKILSVISTLTNTVTGSYSYTGGGYADGAAASGNNVFWDDQGDSQVLVLTVTNGGVPSLTCTDSATLATGMAALSTTYGVSMQGTGDYMNIVNSSTGAVLQHVYLGGTAGEVLSDPTTNLYYARGSNNFEVINLSGTVVNTLSGYVKAIDSSSGRDFVYLANTAENVIQQLNGADDSTTGKSYNFGSSASVTTAAIDAATGDLWATDTSENKVVELDANMNFMQSFTVPSPAGIAFDNGEALVSESGTNVIAIIPEPSCAAFLGLALCGLAVRRWRRSA